MSKPMSFGFLFLLATLPLFCLNGMELTEKEQLKIAEHESLISLKKERDAAAKKLNQAQEDQALALSLQESFEKEYRNSDFEKAVEESRVTYEQEAELALVSEISAREAAEAQEARLIKEEQLKSDYELARQLARTDFDNANQIKETPKPATRVPAVIKEKQEPDCWQLLPDEVKVLILASLPKMDSLAHLFGELARISLVNAEFNNLINDQNLIHHLIKTYKDQQPVLALCKEFFDAAKKGYLPVIKAFAETGFDINAQSKSGKTALHYAVNNGHTKIVKWLIDNNIKLNIEDEKARSGLTCAIRKGNNNRKLVKLLLINGASMDAVRNIDIRDLFDILELQYKKQKKAFVTKTVSEDGETFAVKRLKRKDSESEFAEVTRIN